MSIQKYIGDRYTCLSTDTKPLNVMDGAICLEPDTGKWYQKVSGAWQELPYLTAITKAMVEAVLTGQISSHSHNLVEGGYGETGLVVYYDSTNQYLTYGSNHVFGDNPSISIVSTGGAIGVGTAANVIICTVGGFNLSFTSSPYDGKTFTVVNRGSTAGTVTSYNTVSGGTSTSIAAKSSLTVVYQDGAWHEISDSSNYGSFLTEETDPVFTAWDKSTGISITESQISDLQAYLTGITKAMVEAVLTGTITSHNHSGTYEPADSTIVKEADIDTLAELNAIISDATLIDTNDSRLSDTRTPTDNSVNESKLSTAYKNMETVSGTALDWANMGGTKTLSADTTFTFSNLRKGAYFFETTGDYSPTFPSGFNYAGGTRAATGTTLYQIVCTDSSTPKGWYIILKTES